MLRERGLQQRIGPLEFSELFINVTEILVELRLNFGITVEGLGFKGSTIDQSDDAHGVGGTDGLIATLKQVQHEFLDALGTCGLGQGGVASFRQAHGKKGQHGENEHNGGDAGDNHALMALDKFSYAVRDGVGTRFQRLRAQVVIDVSNQRFHRAVAASGILVHGGKT